MNLSSIRSVTLLATVFNHDLRRILRSGRNNKLLSEITNLGMYCMCLVSAGLLLTTEGSHGEIRTIPTTMKSKYLGPCVRGADCYLFLW